MSTVLQQQQQATQLTQTERWLLGELLRSSRASAAKCGAYAGVVQDPQLRQLVQECQSACQQHLSQISNLLQQAGFAPTP